MINLENKKQLVTMLLAVALGLVAAVLTSQYVKKSITTNINEQTKVFQSKNQALAQQLQASTADIQRLKKNQELLAKQLRERPIMAAAQAIPTQVKGGEIKDDTVFSVQTPPGKRALTIQVDSLSAVGGLVNPGDYVDIIGHLKIPDGPDPKKKPNVVTTVLFQDVQVLAVGTKFKKVGNALTYAAQQKASKLKVTLALTPEEAALMAFADENGDLQMSLRSPREQGKQQLAVASWDTLADYIEENQGGELIIPKEKRKIRDSDDVSFEVDEDDGKSFIQIFREGEEL